MLQVNAKAADGPEILLYDNIGEDPLFGGGVSAKAFAEALAQVGKQPVTVRINSGGGSVFEGAAMYNMLRQHAKQVTVVVDGLAASIASVIAMAGDVVRMGETSWFMIHAPWTFTMGDAAELRRTADTLEAMGNELQAAYQRKSKASESQVQEWMSTETWINARDAVELKLADEVVEPMKAAAWVPFDRFGYKHVPEEVKAVRPSVNTRAGLASMENVLSRLGLDSSKRAR